MKKQFLKIFSEKVFFNFIFLKKISDPNETATGAGGSTESGSNEEERRRRRATRRAERLRRLNSSPPSTLSNILGKDDSD